MYFVGIRRGQELWQKTTMMIVKTITSAKADCQRQLFMHLNTKASSYSMKKVI
jgi:hypothetical protein